MARKPAKLLALPGTPHDQAKAFREFANVCEEGRITCTITVTLEADGTAGLMQTGTSTLIQRLGMLDLAGKVIMAKAAEKGDD